MQANLSAKLTAWAVHVFTASGLLSAFMALLAAVEQDWRETMLWLLLCLVIDGIDGTFARIAKVKEVLPHVSGKYIDYVIDFFTYAILPAYMYFETSGLDEFAKYFSTFMILLVSALYYGIEDMTSADGKHFVGFPVMWNMVVYMIIFVFPDAPPYYVFTAVLILAVMHFLPIYFAYPSMGGRWWPATLGATIIFIGAAIWNVWTYPQVNEIGRWMAIGSTLYFGVLAAVDTYEARNEQIHA
ncbi:hypothetical protein CEQ90_01135 [Lewinellaceae bacterium SD302]|nr:hypothetical protein CEQ90_01135 [Lewinellaceae bacterium SD302]